MRRGPQDLIAGLRKVQSQSTSNPCSVSQWAALAALTGPQDFLAQHNQIFTRRRNKVVAALNAIDGVTCPTPDGAFYVYPSIAGLIGKTSLEGRLIDSDEAFVTALLEEADVATVFGAAFALAPISVSATPHRTPCWRPPAPAFRRSARRFHRIALWPLTSQNFSSAPVKMGPWCFG